MFLSVADSFARPKKIAYWGAGGLTSQIIMMMMLMMMIMFRSDLLDNAHNLDDDITAANDDLHV